MEAEKPGVDRDALGATHALHGPAEPEGIPPGDLHRSDVVDTSPEGGQAVGPQPLFPPAQAGKEGTDGLIAEALLDGDRGEGPARQVGDVDHRDGGEPLLHTGRLDRPIEGQAGTPQNVGEGTGDEHNQAGAEDGYR